MSEQEENFEEAWPVSEREPGPPNGKKEAKVTKGDQGEFLLNLLSANSRHRLLRLVDLPRDALIQAFLAGGKNQPRIATLFTSKEDNARLISLLEVPISDHIEQFTYSNLQAISAHPPHLLIVHLESRNTKAEDAIQEILDVPTLSSLSIVGLVGGQNSPHFKSEPHWAQAVLPMALDDLSLRKQLRNLLDLARARMDLETIYLAHRLSREQLQSVQFTDPLTGLLNRRGFEDSAARELSRVIRTNETAGLIVLDIDRFKTINDTYGHPAGDDVLRELAQILLRETRTLDHVFRFGGEEFGLLLPHTHYEEMVVMAERIRREVENTHFEAMPEAGAVTISMGALSISASKRLRLHDVYPVADELLYRAKQEGRNRVISDKYP